MTAPMRAPNGVNNAARHSTLWNFPTVDPTRVCMYFNDFHTFTAGEWTITTTEAGSAAATEALTDADGGCLLITNDNADNDADFFQKVGEGFLLAPGKRAWFKSRFKVSNATQTDIVMGLQITDTTPLDVTDGIYFLKADDAATVVLVCRKDASTGSTTSPVVATLADDTFVTLGWYYNGKGSLSAFVNDVQITTMDVAAFLPDTELTVSFGIQNGSAAAHTMTVDYVLAAEER